MAPDGKNMNRATAILVVSGIGDQLVVEGCPNITEEPGAIVRRPQSSAVLLLLEETPSAVFVAFDVIKQTLL
jgi:hypothetical protein